MTTQPDYFALEQESLEAIVNEASAAAGIAAADTARAIGNRDYFSLLDHVVRGRGDGQSHWPRLQGSLEALLRRKIFEYPDSPGDGGLVRVVFGTGGHRGIIGEGITLVHVRAVVEALMQRIAAMPASERKRHFDHESLADVKSAGFLFGHDNRLFNQDLACYGMHLMGEAGYRVAYAGRVATPELSRVVPLQGWAGSINFTPSHNPFRYGGIKLSPADGGLAGGDITDALARRANEILDTITAESWTGYEELQQIIARTPARVEAIDVHAPYLDSLGKHPVLRLHELAEEMAALPAGESVHLVADPTWGGAVPVYRALQEILGAGRLTLLHTEDDAYFGGQTTEPNEQTLTDALDTLSGKSSGFGVGIRNDPDGDRGLVGDGGGAIKMNRFAVLVARYLLDLGLHGALVTTHATSHFGPDYARRRGMPVHVTPVGFKNFRERLQSGGALLAYEESDGLTIAGHTLDKDGILVGLLACRMVLHYKKSLQSLLAETEAEYGRYFWMSINFDIDIPAEEAHSNLRPLANIQPGATVNGAGLQRMVAAVNSDDGYKLIFDDDTWLMIRPSGTEPKIRVYGETKENAEASLALCELGKELALSALSSK